MNIVTFGDSWPQGAEMDNAYNKTYGYLLAQKLNADFFNYGKAGASQDALVTQLDNFVTNHYDSNIETIAIFFLTNPARSHYFPEGMDWLTYTWKDNLKKLYLHFHDYDSLRASLSVSACQSWCKQLGIRDYYFAGWNRQVDWMSFVDVSKIWKGGEETAADWFGATNHNGEHLLNVEDNKYIRPNFAHPNEIGHKLIADKLYDWMYKG